MKLRIVIFFVLSILLLIGFISATQDNKADSVLKSKIKFIDATNIEVSENSDGGLYFKSTGTHLKNQKVEIADIDFKAKSKIKNGFIYGWYLADGATVPVVVQIPVSYSNGKYSMDILLSEICIGCATGTATKTQLNMANGSWLNLSALTNVSFAAFNYIISSNNIYKNSTWETYKKIDISNNCLNCVANISTQYNNSDRPFNLSTGLDIPHYHNGSDNFILVNLTGNESSIGIAINSSNSYARASNGNSTYRQFHDADANDYIDPLIATVYPFIVKIKSRGITTAPGATFWGLAGGLDKFVDGDSLTVAFYTSGSNFILSKSANGAPTNDINYTMWSNNTYYTIEIDAISSSSVYFYPYGKNGGYSFQSTTNIPVGTMALAQWHYSGSVGEQLYSTIEKYPSNGIEPTGTYAGSFSNTNFSVWVIPQGYSQSEIVTSNASSMTVNLSAGTYQNFQLFSTSSPFNLTATIYFTQNTTTQYEGSALGYYFNNNSVALGENITNGSINLTIQDATYLSSQFKGTATLNTNNPNATLQTNGNYLNITLGITNTSNFYYNVSVAYNNPPTSTVSNQNFTPIVNATIVSTASDSESNTLYCYGTLNGTTLTSCTSNNFGLQAAGEYTYYFNVTDRNGTLPGAYPWENKTATIIISIPPPPPPPIISGVTISNTAQLISWTSGGGSTVGYNVSLIDGTWINGTMTSINIPITACSPILDTIHANNGNEVLSIPIVISDTRCASSVSMTIN